MRHPEWLQIEYMIPDQNITFNGSRPLSIVPAHTMQLKLGQSKQFPFRETVQSSRYSSLRPLQLKHECCIKQNVHVTICNTFKATLHQSVRTYIHATEHCLLRIIMTANNINNYDIPTNQSDKLLSHGYHMRYFYLKEMFLV